MGYRCSFLLFVYSVLTLLSALSGIRVVEAGEIQLLKRFEQLEQTVPERSFPQTLQKLALKAVEQEKTQEFNSFLENFLSYQAQNPQHARTFSYNQEQAAMMAADLLKVADYFSSGYNNRRTPSLELARWLLGKPERFHTLLNTLSPHDQWTEVCRILETLYEYDAEERDQHFNLILAMAVVWDEKRPPLHRQKGKGRLSYKEKITERYEYFKQLYGSGRALMPEENLTVDDLIFVVDTPVPLVELQWARNNVRGSPRRWGGKFADIEYDYERLRNGAFQWPRGEYSLKNIQERGGICVDQAYFAVLTARAWGIPAMIFSGTGRRGRHAWMGHKIGRNRWEMDAGRYEYDDYVVGRALNPQTNRVISDHELELKVNPDLRGEDVKRAQRQYELAKQLWRLEHHRLAIIYGEEAVKNVAVFAPAWELLTEIAVNAAGKEQTINILDRQAKAFRRFPDKLFEIRSKQARILQNEGNLARAEDVLSRMTPRIGRHRSDLGLKIIQQRVDLLDRMGNQEEARMVMEAYLQENREAGYRIVPSLEYYVKQCRKMGEERQGARFISRYVSRIRIDSVQLERRLLELGIEAFRQTEDERGLERAIRKLQRLE